MNIHTSSIIWNIFLLPFNLTIGLLIYVILQIVGIFTKTFIRDENEYKAKQVLRIIERMEE